MLKARNDAECMVPIRCMACQDACLADCTELTDDPQLGVMEVIIGPAFESWKIWKFKLDG